MYIPKSVRDAEGKVFFKAFSTGTLQGFSFNVSECMSTPIHHMVSITLPDINDGEYEYTLSDEGGVLSTGILVIGGQSKPVEYINNMTYEQYTE